MSLFELPVSRGARTARVVVVLLLNVVLAGAGVAMIYSYWKERQAAERAGGATSVSRPPDAAPPEIEVADPRPVATAPKPKPKADPGPASTAAPERPARTTRPSNKTSPRDPGPEPDPEPEPEPEPDNTPPPPPASPPDAAPLPPVDDVDEDDTELTAGKVRQVVNQHFTQLKRCYQQAAKVSSPSEPLQGRLDIQFTIMPDGTAANVRAVANSTGSDQLATCVVRLVESWAFPSPGAESIDFIWPFEFKAPQ